MGLSDHLLTTVDLAATLILSIEFALAGVRADLDVFGVGVRAFVGAVGGGVMRDLLLGEQPPAALRDRRYPVIALLGAGGIVAASVLGGSVGTWNPPMALDLIEAAGLALAAVAGARKALDYDLKGASVVAIAVVGSCGGGVLRDVLTAQIPRIFRTDFYATAAVAGSIIMIILVRHMRTSKPLAAAVTGVTVFALRTAAIIGGWSLPHLR